MITTNDCSERESIQDSRSSSNCFQRCKQWRFIVGCFGAVSYETFSIFVSSPDLARLVFNDYMSILLHFIFCSSGIMSQKMFSIASNALWVSAHSGLICYIFCSNLMQQFSFGSRVLYSCTGGNIFTMINLSFLLNENSLGMMFNFGSVLLWAILKKAAHRTLFRLSYTLASGLALLYIGSSFLSTSPYYMGED